jgi:hypothetical protein
VKTKREYHDAMMQCKKSQLSKKISDLHDKPKKLWHELNKALGRGKVKTLPKKEPPKETAEKFNLFFDRKVQDVHDSLPPAATTMPVVEPSTDNPPDQSDYLNSFILASEKEIKDIIKSSPRKSDVADPIPTWLLLVHLETLLPAITVVVNCALVYGMPTVCKHAIIRPSLKKKGTDPEALGNYRPVSILPYISKVIERVIAARLSKHLETNSLLDSQQSAYRPAHSCETALASVMNDLLLAIDDRKVAVLALFDLSAAFDTVDHGLLSHALRKVHICDQAHSWLVDYLSHRTQSVIIENYTSSPSPLLSGVPQGSVIGPVLFCIYLNGIGRILQRSNTKYKIYADDIQLCTVADPNMVSSAINTIQEVAMDLCTWLSLRKLKMKEEKTDLMVVASKRILKRLKLPTAVRICGSDIPLSHVLRNLGFHMDESLSLSHHVARICGAAFAYLRTIGRLRNCLPLQVRLSAIHALVTSRIIFCAPLLYGMNKSHLQQLQRVLNASVRVTFGKKRRENVDDIMKTLAWLPVEHLITSRLLHLVHRALHTGSPYYLSELLRLYNPSRQLRSSDTRLLEVPPVRTGSGERAFSRAAPLLWNNLPNEIRLIDGPRKFRVELHKHLLSLV